MPDAETQPAPLPVLARKAEMEAAMAAAPNDPALRTAYFDLLATMSASGSGLLFAHLPDIAAPLAFRAGTPDLPALAEVFRDNILGFAMAPTPRRILLLGAFAGYTAVDLARRYPRAEILAVEPLPDNIRLLHLNTAAWRRIRVAPVAAWHSATRVSAFARFQADWSVRMGDEGLDANRVLPALPVRDILAQAGWDHADMIVCDTTGAEREIFADRFEPWLGGVDALLIRVYALDKTTSGAPAVQAAFPPGAFDCRKAGEFHLFTRSQPRTTEPKLPPALPLLRTDPGLQPFWLNDVPPGNAGFFIFDGGSCQLHPSGLHDRPARAIFVVGEPGYRRFQAGIAHAGLLTAKPVVFTVFAVQSDGRSAAQDSMTLAPQQTGRISLKLPELPAPFHIVLQTAMEPDTTDVRLAWARWLEPKLV